jgi:hypothetical protein
MSEEDFQERDHPANRERDRARLVRVSSAAGVETEAPAEAGASVENCERCGDGWFCADHVPEPLILTSWLELARERPDAYLFTRDQLLTNSGRYVRWYADGAEDEPKPRGRPEEGITERDEIIAALVGYTGTISCTVRNGVIRARPGSLKQYRAGLGGSIEGINTKAEAEFFGVTPRTIRDWRAKTSANSPSSREADLEPATKADVDAVRELVVETNETANAILEVLLDEFGGEPMIARAVDRFVDGALDANRVDAD